ncbi:MAG: hypothetical protein K8823_233 [Cenarchaeum symbiont of Oopsacas minuta]|nr:hypothetical protein [Cenarchaeum symbiont of Oopsacas minuta]
MEYVASKYMDTVYPKLQAYCSFHINTSKYEKHGLKGLKGVRSRRPRLISTKKFVKLQNMFTETGTVITAKQLKHEINKKLEYHTHVYRIMRNWDLTAKVPQKSSCSCSLCRRMQ